MPTTIAATDCRFCHTPVTDDHGETVAPDVCAECSEDARWCTVCGTHVDTRPGAACQHPHLRWDDDAGHFVGCGTEDVGADYHKAGFLALLTCLDLGGRSWSQALDAALAVGRYTVRTYGSMFGDEGLCLSLGAPVPSRVSYEALLLGDGPTPDAALREVATRVRPGMLWLLSLEAGVTTEAEARTRAWIAEYRAQTAARA